MILYFVANAIMFFQQDKVGAEKFSRMVQGFAAKHAEQQAVEEVSESGD